MPSGELFAESTVLFITLFVMMLGLIFTVVPPIPGTRIIWGGAIFYGFSLGWEKLGWWTLGLLTFFMLVGIAADIVAGHFGAKIGGAACSSIAVGAIFGFILGIIGSLSGIPLFGCIGGLGGTLGGILLMERWYRGDWNGAYRAVKGYLTGTALGAMAKVTSGVLMFGIFFISVSMA
ncbi:MAG: DUF456 domain-containing protein [Anaerolineae bacterium]|nr:DUF456 domain-containing protein [Anaerolineae bacterium]